ncbi:hypothetical protein QWY31_05960 [Cytophagales bacterium LB-30]|uniref:Uncharacterized protein n=1 Tax=Shiella aurantiaca TaxID=3058365 RepID=A0ABT8F3T3_9BACT|nr:hypothetical protein [Shiella aurantiaca]
MVNRKTIDELKYAVNNRLTIKVKMKHGLGDNLEIEIDPYIIGSDLMQYDFIWGYISHSRTFYKLMLNFVQSIKLTSKNFKTLPKTVYLYSNEEDHYESVDDITIYGLGL